MSRNLIDDVFDTDDNSSALHVGKACGYVICAVLYARGKAPLGMTWRSNRWRKFWVGGAIAAAVLEVAVAVSKFIKEEEEYIDPTQLGDYATVLSPGAWEASTE